MIEKISGYIGGLILAVLLAILGSSINRKRVRRDPGKSRDVEPDVNRKRADNNALEDENRKIRAEFNRIIQDEHDSSDKQRADLDKLQSNIRTAREANNRIREILNRAKKRSSTRKD